MDKVIKKKNPFKKYIATLAVLVVIVASAVAALDWKDSIGVERDRLAIAEVIEGQFEDFILITGYVQPIRSVFIDAIEGGIIQEVQKTSGEQVQEGETIISLTNSNLQLDVLNREAQLYEQINNVKNTRLLLDQNLLNLKNELAEIDYQLEILKPELERKKVFFERKMISQKEFEDFRAQFKLYQQKRENTASSYKRDSAMKQLQMQQLDESEKRMWQSLNSIGKIADNLTVKAPIKGQLSTPDWQVGQSIERGERIGQIDMDGGYKVRAKVDEIYLPKTEVGQKAKLHFDQNDYVLTVTKIYPSIKQGTFEVDLLFENKIPANIKRGLSLHMQLQYEQTNNSKMLQMGGFYQSTGGNYVYVLSDDGQTAQKRKIKLGKQNSKFIEVTSGLSVGEKVIVSGYENFGDKEILDIH
ncbi:efflux RND transporter periplasmic adaptor subunit [Sediminitomix flava]|uniref:HlyD family secretion protein n=1 Tax=Sediminitomix flava TaxID=379075 RepID=A0A315ZND6_SEDFL|nr:HlyD family efflux transporter periplasmic adaptor subunit [Sediminitomix flava]PWJ36019.1 HlyD family secretion protein [Sediminitomix flava]